MDSFEVPQLLLTALAGLGVGFLSGVFGLGGGFLIVPVLHILLGVRMEFAVGAGACQVLGPATTSLLARRPERENFRVPLIIAGGQAVGTFLGAAILTWTASGHEEATIEIAGQAMLLKDLLVLTLYFVILTSVGLFSIWEAGHSRVGERKSQGWLTRIVIPPTCAPVELNGRRVSITLLAWFGLIVGLLSGLLGMSGGFLVLPGLIFLLGMKTHHAVLSSLVIVWIGAISNTIAHAWNGHIHLYLVMALLVGGTFGARWGSEVGKRWAGTILRRRFGWVLIATSGMIAARLAYLFLR